MRDAAISLPYYEDMLVRALQKSDLDWAVEVLQRRRRTLCGFAPRFWAPAPDAPRIQADYLARALSEGARGWRTDDSVLIATGGASAWNVDDAAMGTDWDSPDAFELWEALRTDVAGAPLTLVCPVYEEDRNRFALSSGLQLSSTWWLQELPRKGLTWPMSGPGSPPDGMKLVKAPPVYEPGGPVLFLPDARLAREAANLAVLGTAHGCSAVVVNVTPDEREARSGLEGAGFRAHCNYFVA